MKELTKWQQFQLKHFDKRKPRDYWALQHSMASALFPYLEKMNEYLQLLKKVESDPELQKGDIKNFSIYGKKYNSFNEYFRLIILEHKEKMNTFLEYITNEWDEIEYVYNFCKSKSNKEVTQVMNEYGEIVPFNWDEAVKKAKPLIKEMNELNFLESTNKIKLKQTNELFLVIYEGQQIFRYIAPKLAYFSITDSYKRHLPECLKIDIALEFSSAAHVSYDNFVTKIDLGYQYLKDDKNFFVDKDKNNLLKGSKF